MDATTFPISFGYHLFFAIAAGLFFFIQFYRFRRPYQLLFGIGLPASLLIYINSTSQTLFHAIGLFEFVLIVGAIVLSTIQHIQKKRKSSAGNDLEVGEETETTSN